MKISIKVGQKAGQLFGGLLVVLLLLGGSVNSFSAEDARPGEQTATSMSAVNINTASVEEIALTLNGIGEKRAQAIVEYRSAHGPFTDKNQLLNVKGVGEATLTKNSTLIVLK
jgi:competence ComEA-like helix-hairpin-helix protein